MNPALVCIPTYNERENLEPICKAVLEAEPRVDILVVDDNSPDGTGVLADELAAKEPRIQVLHREKKQGLGKAYLHAFSWALEHGYQYVIEMDADFSHDPRYLPRLLDEAMGGADLVLGSRYVSGGGTVNWGVGRKVISQGSSSEPVGVAPQRAEAVAKMRIPITTIRRWPATSARRPPKAKRAESASR